MEACSKEVHATPDGKPYPIQQLLTHHMIINFYSRNVSSLLVNLKLKIAYEICTDLLIIEKISMILLTADTRR